MACLGTAGETAESYSIALMNGEENIGNYTVEPMILGDMKSYTCSWTPRAAGEASIYALLTLDDVVTSTDTITVSVAEESLISTVMIGDLSTEKSTPNYTNYLYEILYTPEDLVGLQAGDVIETVNIPYYATDAAIKGYRINIWIGNTEKNGSHYRQNERSGHNRIKPYRSELTIRSGRKQRIASIFRNETRNSYYL